MTTQIESKALNIGIEYLSATKSNGRYHYFDDASGQWWLSDESDVRDLGERLIALDEAIEDGTSDEDDTCSLGALYSRWCGDTDSRPAQALKM